MSEDAVKMKFEAEGELLKFVEDLNRRLKELEGTSEAAKSSTGQLDGVVKKVAAAFSAGAIALKAYQFAMKGVAEATGNMMAAAKVEAVIKATGAAAGVTAQQLAAMSAEMAANTTHTDNAIQEAQSLLLTFKEISGDVFPQAMGAISDMAVMFGGLESAAMQVGKALNDPAEGLAALSRAGVKFNDEQTKIIKSLVETGDVAGAQAVILKQLESQFGGVAKAIADTPAGKLQQLKNEFSEIQATLGERLIPALVAFQSALNSVAKFLTDHTEVIVGIAAGALVLMQVQIKATTASIQKMTVTMMANPLFAAAAVLAVSIMAVGAAIGAITKRIEESNKAIGDMSTSVTILQSSLTDTTEAYDKFMSDIAKSTMSAAEIAATAVATLFGGMEKALETKLDKTKSNIEKNSAALVKLEEANAALRVQIESDAQFQMISAYNKGKQEQIRLAHQAMIDAVNKNQARISRINEANAKEVENAETVEAQIAAVQIKYSGERVKAVMKATESERNAWAANVKAYQGAMEQIRLSGMTEQERELAALDKQVAGYIASAQKIGKGTVEIEEWAASQRADINAAYWIAAKQARDDAFAEEEARISAEAAALRAALKQTEDEQKAVMKRVTAYEAGEWEARRIAIRDKFDEEKKLFTAGSTEYIRLMDMTSKQIIEIDRQEKEARERAQEELERKQQESWQRMIELPVAWGDAAISSLNSVMSVFSNMNSNKMKEIDKVSSKEIAAINNSRMSNKVKAMEIDRIEEEAAAKKHELAVSQWKIDKAMAIVNSAAAVVKTMATVPYPANIPLAIAQGVAGGAQVAIIEQNKPKMQFGGFVPGQSWSGDQVDIRANSGEAVLTPAQQRNFMLMANGGASGGTRTVNVGDTNIVINGSADSATVDAIGRSLAEHRQGIIELLYEAERRGEIDHSRLAFA